MPFGVEVVGRDAGRHHAQIVRQMALGRQQHLVLGDPRGERRRHELAPGMDPRVRPTCGFDRDGLARQLGEGLLEGALDGAGARLLLPASKTCTVVGDDQAPGV